MKMRAAWPAPAVVLALLLSGCGGAGGGSSTPATTPAPAAPGLNPPAAPPVGTAVDDWTTYAHDYRRTGYQAQTLTVTKANAGSLKLRWQAHVSSLPINTSPIVAGGLVYVGGDDGIVRALNVADGSVAWQQAMGGPVVMTPTLADGKLFVGTHIGSSDTFAALDAATGAVRWAVHVGGCIRAEPVVANGVVYEGISCGDPSQCFDGGVSAFDENSGAVIWSWKTTSVTNNGGGQWSPISYDGQHLFFGTGNVCTIKEAGADAVVSLTPAGSQTWAFQPGDPRSDDDFGGGSMINNGQIFAASKNGFLFDLDANTGRQIWATRLTTIDGYGPIGTPATDGSILVVSTGFKSDPTHVTVNPGGGLAGVSPAGSIVWQISTQNSVAGSAAIANGIAFVDLDNSVTALDAATGAKLWSYAATAYLYASPAIVPSGLYTADRGGYVYAFSLPAGTASAARRSSI